ncbi:FAD-binding oxidoreductase [Elongatibacter sediminis]|uniref:FAD-binding oxidoreductase n=1 Tax=Elongatibacter sediminis TaxID=3119006 RepID=A0AAW9R591_9GAMM
MTDLIAQLRDIVGEAGVLTGADVAAHSDTWPPRGDCQAHALIRPASTAEVAEVMKCCHAARQPVVTHGGLTGLVRGSVTRPGDIVLSLQRMRRIENIDRDNRTMTVQAGVALQTVHEAAEEAELLFPLDLGARGSCTIGGNISTNAGGNSVIRYGMMREQVLGLEVVLADGTIVSSMNSVLKNNTGYDLKQWFIGAEGTLGIVTRAVLRLRPLPRSRNTALVAATDFDRVAGLLRTMDTALGGSLSAFEVLWNDFYRLIIGDGENHGVPLATDYPFYVLLEATGSHEDIDRQRFERALEEAFEGELIADAIVAQSEQQREDLWAIRDDIDHLVERLAPTITFDVSLDIPQMDAYVHEVRDTLTARIPGSRCVFFGHIGDGNIHPVLTVGKKEGAAVSEAKGIVYDALRKRGGVVSAEHGIGLEKRPYLGHSRSAVEIELMKTLKRTLDPHNLLNPGKIFSLQEAEQ